MKRTSLLKGNFNNRNIVRRTSELNFFLPCYTYDNNNFFFFLVLFSEERFVSLLLSCNLNSTPRFPVNETKEKKNFFCNFHNKYYFNLPLFKVIEMCLGTSVCMWVCVNFKHISKKKQTDAVQIRICKFYCCR